MRQKSELRSYQQRVIKHLYENDEALAVLKMGAGKTISTLTAIEELIGDGVIRHALIVAPKRVATLVWPAEIEAWAHTRYLKYAVLDGDPAERMRRLVVACDRDITIIGIDNVQWLVEYLTRTFSNGKPVLFGEDHPIFDLLVLDETSKLKNPAGKRAKALASIAGRFRNRWGLTGTPAPNSLLDLFAPLKIITDGTLWGKSFYTWRQRNFYAADYKGYDWKVIPGHEDQILADAASVSIALGEGDMPDLPELSVLIDEVELPPDARKIYKDMETKLLAEVEGESVLAASAAIASGKLAQAVSGFMYGSGGASDVNWIHDAKSEWLVDTVENLGSESAIIVFQFLEELQMLRRLFGDIPHLGGGTSDADGRRHVEDWNAGKLPLLAIHPASAGHGLNLQAGGSRMLWISPTWSPEMHDQVIARILRPGQISSHVMVHICTARGTVDELKLSRVHLKLSAQQAFERFLAGVRGAVVA